MSLLKKLTLAAVACASANAAFAQALDLFGTSATTQLSNSSTGLFTQQSVGTGAVSATIDPSITTDGNTPLVTGGTVATESYVGASGATLDTDNGGLVTLSNSASNSLNQFTASSGTITTLLGSGVTLASTEIAVAQQGLVEGDTTATFGLPDMTTAVSNLTLANSAVGTGNSISLEINPLE